ncbi:MAG TPA: hypothetical protein VGC13_00870 [Longimicrobium sp.]|jgi:hypothetical protein|uniref:hypothetical protein n=1 Tax=Longimicrobium sp. TaxID=2029185 RepID=UPI002ED89C1B
MKIAFESELMENQKHATVLSPDQRFDALQTRDGFSLFFSIGTDGVFYLTQGAAGGKTGWSRMDLSSTLAAQHAGTAVTAKTFGVSQDPQTGNIDLALAVTAGGGDFLYVSQGNANTDDSWGAGVQWTAVPYDGSSAMPSLSIADVYVMQAGGAEYIVVDVMRQPASALNLIDRYWVTPSGAPKWNEHALAADLSAGSIVSRLGMRPGDYTAGVYTFGQIGGTQELLYTPLYNAFNKALPPSPARLTVPAGAAAMATALNGAGQSSVFVAGGGALYLFTPANQHDGAVAVQVAANPVLAGVRALSAATTAAATAVWGINAQDQLFYLRCPAGREADPTAWSYPLPLLAGVEQMASYLNQGADSSVIFAETSGQTLVRLTQDPVTTAWSQRAVLLPSTDPGDVVKFTSYTTHLQVTDDRNVGAGATPLSLTSSSPVGVYLNDVYYVLSPDVAVNVAADVTGVLTIVQPTQGLAGVSYHVEVPSGSVSADVNPMDKVVQRLSAIQSGADLAAVQVTNADGTRQPLVPAGVSADQTAAAAQALGQLSAVAGTLPRNGETASPPAATGAGTASGTGSAEAAPPDGPPPTAAPSAPAAAGGGGESIIEVAAGDLLNWLNHVAPTVVEDAEVVIHAAEDAWHCVITWVDQTFRTVLHDLGSVLQTVEMVLKKIEIGIEDAIKFLGFLFEWGDIVRTHNVIKNLVRISVAQVGAALATAEEEVKSRFAELDQHLNAWADLPDDADTLGSYQAAAPAQPGQNAPQANWALYHTKSNLYNLSTAGAEPAAPDAAGNVVTDLLTLLKNDLEAFSTAANSLKTQVFDAWNDISLKEAAKRIVAVLGELLLAQGENIILAVLDVLRSVSDSLLDMLDAPISIPVLSPLYKEISGNDLSMLDLVCLVVAVPATVVFKMVAKMAPFPDNATTATLIAGSSLAALPPLAPPAAPGSAVRGGVYAMMAPVGDDASASPADPPSTATSGSAVSTPGTEASRAQGEWSWWDVFAFCMNLGAGVAMPLVIATNAAKRRGGSGSGGSARQPAGDIQLTHMGNGGDAEVNALLPQDGGLDASAEDLSEIPSLGIRGLSLAAYTFYAAPNFLVLWDSEGGRRYTANVLLALVSIGKTGVDNSEWGYKTSGWQEFSPLAEIALNGVWLVDALLIYAYVKERTRPDTIGFAGNVAFDLGGMLSPFGKNIYVFLAAQALAAIYGTSCGWIAFNTGPMAASS